MGDVKVLGMGLRQVAEAIRTGQVSGEEVAEAAVRRALEVQGKLHAFVWLDPDRTLEEARRRARQAPQGPLHGVPLTLKDLIAERGAPFTCGSKRRAEVRAESDAEITRRLRQAGAVFLGRAHLHEFAYGVTNDNPHFGPARNPWDPTCSPGGSSGGSAVAVSTGCVFGSVGTDTGGSVRIPAALCGVVGLKPTYELVPRDGVFPLSPSLDHVGPLARKVEDAALLLEVLAARPGRYTAGLNSGVRGLRLGVPSGAYWDVLDPQVAERVEEAVRVLEAEGAHRVGVDFPWEASSAVATALLMVEAASVHAQGMRSDPGGYGADVRERLLVGLVLPAERYVQALRVRRLLARLCRDLWSRVDLLATPTVPIRAPRLGQSVTEVRGTPYDTRSLLTRFTNPFNVLGLPALSVPCGLVDGLPVGLQLIGRPGDEATVLAAGAVYERATGPWLAPPGFP